MHQFGGGAKFKFIFIYVMSFQMQRALRANLCKHASLLQRTLRSGFCSKVNERTVEEEELKLRILNHAVAHNVAEHGWSQRSLQAAAKELGLPAVAHGLFPGAGFDLVSHFYSVCNAHLEHELAETPRKPTKDFLTTALRTRLLMLTPYIDTWPQAMALQAMPQHATASWANLGDLVDLVWHLAGDNSTDLNWYSKRLVLAVVYKSSELFLIQDRSPDFSDTWHFLDRRLEDAMAAGKWRRFVSGFASGTPDLLRGAAIIGQNVLRR